MRHAFVGMPYNTMAPRPRKNVLNGLVLVVVAKEEDEADDAC